MSHTFCTGCGARVDEESAFCTICGLSVTAAEPDSQPQAAEPEPQSAPVPPDTAPPTASYTDYNAESPHTQAQAASHTQTYTAQATTASTPPPPQGDTWPSPQAFYETPPSPHGQYALMTTAQILGSLLLMMIPVIGWLTAIVWAAGGCRKVNKQSLARAFLIVALAGLFLLAACLFLFWPWFVMFWNELISRLPVYFYWG